MRAIVRRGAGGACVRRRRGAPTCVVQTESGMRSDRATVAIGAVFAGATRRGGASARTRCSEQLAVSCGALLNLILLLLSSATTIMTFT